MLLVAVIVIVGLVVTASSYPEHAPPGPPIQLAGDPGVQILREEVLIDSSRLPAVNTPQRAQFVSDFRDQLSVALGVDRDNIDCCA